MALTHQETDILRSIRVPSENDPARPEFPDDNPRFPATPTVTIEVPGFAEVLLKDESFNPTGTHKDRMAWEIVVTYRDILLAKQGGQWEGPLPSMSIISSGSAAVAIQSMLIKYHLPRLKVLVDVNIPEKSLRLMEDAGCEIYRTDLSRKAYNWQEILHLTNNPNGLDITSAEALDPTTRFYDWLSYEILNQNPAWCFVPFGTGHLYENILNILKREVSGANDPRFSGDTRLIRRCNFLGATTNDPKSKLEKLYSPHLPFVHYDEQWIRLYRSSGICGPASGVKSVQEEFVDEGLALAERQDIRCEPSGIAGLALLLQMREEVPKDARILIVNTGKTHLPKWFA